MQTQQLPQDPKESYTILRIKRKRNEEPLDALGMFSAVNRGCMQRLIIVANTSCRSWSQEETIERWHEHIPVRRDRRGRRMG